jgi:CBS domain-containing protein
MDASPDQPLVIGSSVTIMEAARLMEDEHVGSIPIVEGDQLVGVLTEHDLVRGTAQGRDPESTVASDLIDLDLEQTQEGESEAPRGEMHRVPASLTFELHDRKQAVEFIESLPSWFPGHLVEHQADRWEVNIEVAEPETCTFMQLLKCVENRLVKSEPAMRVRISGREYTLAPEFGASS